MTSQPEMLGKLFDSNALTSCGGERNFVAANVVPPATYPRVTQLRNKYAGVENREGFLRRRYSTAVTVPPSSKERGNCRRRSWQHCCTASPLAALWQQCLEYRVLPLSFRSQSSLFRRLFLHSSPINPHIPLMRSKSSL